MQPGLGHTLAITTMLLVGGLVAYSSSSTGKHGAVPREVVSQPTGEPAPSKTPLPSRSTASRTLATQTSTKKKKKLCALPRPRQSSSVAIDDSAKAAEHRRVHVAMSASANQLRGLVVAIASVLVSTPTPSAVTIHLFLAEDAAQVRALNAAIACIRKAGARRGAAIEVHTIDSKRGFRLLHGRGQGAVANLVRFYLPQLLPHVDTVLWIDADGLVLGDVSHLTSTLFTGEHAESAVAAVERPGKELGKATGLNEKDLRALGLSRVGLSDSVFNAGFLGLNLRAWRKQDTTSRVERLVVKLGQRGFKGFPGISTKEAGAVHDSQTPLVLLFKNQSRSIQQLPGAWNIEGLGWKKVPRERVCTGLYLHWSGRFKPWRKPHVNDTGLAYYRDVWQSYAAMALEYGSVECAPK